MIALSEEPAGSPASDVPVNPVLPDKFNCTPNDQRPESHRKWWNRPYIVTQVGSMWGDDAAANAKWLEAWPSGVRYDVYCLDGSAWERSSWWGSFNTLAEAQACAKAGPS